MSERRRPTANLTQFAQATAYHPQPRRSARGWPAGSKQQPEV